MRQFNSDALKDYASQHGLSSFSEDIKKVFGEEYDHYYASDLHAGSYGKAQELIKNLEAYRETGVLDRFEAFYKTVPGSRYPSSYGGVQ